MSTPRSPQPRRHGQTGSTGNGKGRAPAARKPAPKKRAVDHSKPLARRAPTPPRGTRRPPPSGPARWLPAIAAAGILGVVVMAGASSGGDDGASGTTSSPETFSGTSPDGASIDSLTVPAQTQPVVITGSTLPEIQKDNLASPVAKGSAGGDVKKIQERLLELGFAPGPADGYFGDLTQQAVWAYKKLVMAVPRDELDKSQSASLITNETWLAMQDPITIQPRRLLGAGTTHVEIYLPQQVMIVFTDDKPTMIAHVSSGDEQTWCEMVKYDTGPEGEPLEELVERDECGKSYTPGGVFRIKRFVTGIRQSPLGSMYDPVYFNYGIAVHGASNVPLHPASHGCIRLQRDLGEIFPTLVKKGNRVYVWGQDGREPEQYGFSPAPLGSVPIFNYPNPNSTTTTSSSTTSTVPKTTTTKPESTTTTAPKSTTTATPTATTTAPTAPPTTPAPATTAAPVTAAPTTSPPATSPPTTDPPITIP